MFDINQVVAPTRRETLLNVQNILEDDKKLSAAAGQCVLLDVTLTLLAGNSPELEERLSRYLSVDDLQKDIAHTGNHHKIKQELEKRRKYARLYR